jgi:hypothetical protein
VLVRRTIVVSTLAALVGFLAAAVSVERQCRAFVAAIEPP